MALCNPNCAANLPVPIKDCDIDTRPGGIHRFVFLKCNSSFTDIYNVSEWCNKQTADELIMSPPLLGQKPRANITKKRFSSCTSERVVGKEFQIQFVDHNADDQDFKDYDFWNTLQDKPNWYRFGFITCDGLFYGFVDNWIVEVDDVIPETNLDVTRWEGTVFYNGYLSIKPLLINNGQLVQSLLRDCAP